MCCSSDCGAGCAGMQVDEAEPSSSSKAEGAKAEPSSYMLANPARVTSAQERYISFNADERWRPLRSNPPHSGILMCVDTRPGESSSDSSFCWPCLVGSMLRARGRWQRLQASGSSPPRPLSLQPLHLDTLEHAANPGGGPSVVLLLRLRLDRLCAGWSSLAPRTRPACCLLPDGQMAVSYPCLVGAAGLVGQTAGTSPAQLQHRVW